MNFIEDVVEAFPAARRALIEVDAEGGTHVHHFGELFARSAGLSGAFAARGVGRGDVVMTLVGSRVEWVLAMLACWRMGAVALPCNPQLRRKDLELRAAAAGPKLAVGEQRYLGELPDGIPYMEMDDIAAHPRRGPGPGDPRRRRRPGAERPGGDRLHLGHDRRAARRRLPAALPRRPAAPGRALVRVARGRRGLVHGRPGLGEVDPQRLRRPLADRRRRRPPRRPIRPRGAPAPLRGAGRQRPLPGADRVPDARVAGRAGADPLAAPAGLGRRADRAGGDPGLPRATRPLDRRRLRPDRDGRDRRDGAGGGRSRPRRLDGAAAAGPRDPRRRRRAPAPAVLIGDLLRPLPRRRALRGRLVADRRPGPRGRGRLPLVRGPQRRPDPLLRVPDRPVRGRVGARLAPGGDGGRGGRRPRPRARLGGPRDRRPRRRRGALRRARARAPGARQSADGALQVPADRRVRGRTCRRRPAARSAGPSCAAVSLLGWRSTASESPS